MANTASYLSNSSNKSKESLDALNILLQNGIITKEEFDLKRNSIFN